MKTSQQWMEEQFGIWQHPTTGNWMGYVEMQAQTFKELVELIQEDALKKENEPLVYPTSIVVEGKTHAIPPEVGKLLLELYNELKKKYNST